MPKHRSLLAMLVCTACASGSPRPIEPPCSTLWPKQLALLRWQPAPMVAQPGRGVGIPADASRQDVELAARAWLLSQFEAVPDVELEVVAHDDPTNDNTAPSESCVVLMQTFRGLATDRASVVYLSPECVKGEYLEVGSFEVIPDTMCPAVSERDVRRTIASFLPNLGIDASHAADVKLRMQYVWQSGNDKSAELRPVWLLGQGPFLVDARTGEPGRDG